MNTNQWNKKTQDVSSGANISVIIAMWFDVRNVGDYFGFWASQMARSCRRNASSGFSSSHSSCHSPASRSAVGAVKSGGTGEMQAKEKNKKTTYLLQILRTHHHLRGKQAEKPVRLFSEPFLYPPFTRLQIKGWIENRKKEIVEKTITLVEK
jgi:hypothetical protein